MRVIHNLGLLLLESEEKRLREFLGACLEVLLEAFGEVAAHLDGRVRHSDHGVGDQLLEDADNAAEIAGLDLGLVAVLVELVELLLLLGPGLELGHSVLPLGPVLGQNVNRLEQIKARVLILLLLLLLADDVVQRLVLGALLLGPGLPRDPPVVLFVVLNLLKVLLQLVLMRGGQ